MAQVIHDLEIIPQGDERIVREEPPAHRELSTAALIQRVQKIQEVAGAVMKRGVDFGEIPGCPKPSLFKPGAEKLAVTFGIRTKESVEDLSTSDECRYRVTAKAFSPSGELLAEAMGECSSNEKKYKWRSPICRQEFDETPSDRRREVWTKDGKKYQQVRTDFVDAANTILQMASKRAFVAVIRRATGASDVFTQDIEDLPAEVVAEIVEQVKSETGREPFRMPASKSKPAASSSPSAAPAPSGDKLYVRAVTEKSGEKDGKPWTRYTVEFSDDSVAQTFSEGIGEAAKRARADGLAVSPTLTPPKDPKYSPTLSDLSIVHPA